MTDPGAGEKLKVFISYSRRDSAAFADELVAGLEVAGFAPFLDRHDIAAGEDWEARLGGLIAQSDTVVFVVSPEAVKSKRCEWEVDRSIDLSKRLLPVISKQVPDHDIPEKLRRLQFVRFDSGLGFARSLSELAAALRVNLTWIREHTRLAEFATRWGRGRQESLLLRGDEIDAAKTWMAARNAAAPEITDAQRAFVKASEEVETARLAKEQAQFETIARQKRRIVWLLCAWAMLGLATISYQNWQSYDLARRALSYMTGRVTQSLNDGQFDRAMRYALHAYPAYGHLPWGTPFSTELEIKLSVGAQFTRLHRLLKGHSAPVVSAAFSNDGRRVVTASSDDTASDNTASDNTGSENSTFDNTASDNTGSENRAFDNTARIWDAESGKEIAVLNHDGPVQTAAFSNDGKRVVTASEDKTARIWNAQSGKEVAVLKGHDGSVLTAAFSNDGKRVVTASYDNTARIWDAESGKEIAVLNHDGPVQTAAFSNDGKRVVTASEDKTARIWNADVAILKGTHVLSTAAFSGDSKRVVTAFGAAARIWDAESGKEIAVLKDHDGSVQTAAFSGDGKRVVTASRDSTARIWDVTWLTLVRGDALRERVCAEKLIGAAQEFTDVEMKEVPILRGIDKNDPVVAQSVPAPWPAVARLLDAPSGRSLAFHATAYRRELNAHCCSEPIRRHVRRFACQSQKVVGTI